MVRDGSSNSKVAASTLARLDQHFAEVLSCRTQQLRQRGVHVIGMPPVESHNGHDGLLLRGIMSYKSGGCVLQCVDRLAAQVESIVTAAARKGVTPEVALRQHLAELGPAGTRLHWRRSIIYYTDSLHFRPHGVDVSVRIELLPEHGDDNLDLRLRFNGSIFVIREGSGRTVAWAGIQRISEHADAITAETRSSHRGRGLATVLTTAATQHVLADARIPIWLAAADDAAAQRLVERLGFTVYGEQFVAAVGRSGGA